MCKYGRSKFGETDIAERLECMHPGDIQGDLFKNQDFQLALSTGKGVPF
jgi:hypothetical protein